MHLTSFASPSSTHLSHHTDPRADVTVKSVNWDALLLIACNALRVQQATWGEQVSGGFNLVRFLRLANNDESTIVVRVPLHPEVGTTSERVKVFCDRIASEVATMQYLEVHTSIPVPHVVHYSAELDDNGVRSPYSIMSKVNGISLFSVWDGMPDEKRDIILRQVVDIYLELATHRFDKIGALVKRQRDGRDVWGIEPCSFVMDQVGSEVAKDISSVVYSSGTDYWIAYANAKLKRISEEKFGSGSKSVSYAQNWLLRSLIPSLYDVHLDAHGFPLLPGDFHSQNIFITQADSEPRITAIIDWEFTSTACTSSFAQYPFFIVDHPAWDDGHPLRPRNIRDQVVFNRFMRDAERKRDPSGNLPLSRAFANFKGVYLFEQCIKDDFLFNCLYNELFAFVFGDEEEFSGDYFWALMEKGILREETKRFNHEVEALREANSILKDEINGREFTRGTFLKLIAQHKDRFLEGGTVRIWLASLGRKPNGLITR